jgi:hypothetical protein
MPGTAHRHSTEAIYSRVTRFERGWVSPALSNTSLLLLNAIAALVGARAVYRYPQALTARLLPEQMVAFPTRSVLVNFGRRSGRTYFNHRRESHLREWTWGGVLAVSEAMRPRATMQTRLSQTALWCHHACPIVLSMVIGVQDGPAVN